jgi:hypothetical protein
MPAGRSKNNLLTPEQFKQRISKIVRENPALAAHDKAVKAARVKQDASR